MTYLEVMEYLEWLDAIVPTGFAVRCIRSGTHLVPTDRPRWNERPFAGHPVHPWKPPR